MKEEISFNIFSLLHSIYLLYICISMNTYHCIIFITAASNIGWPASKKAGPRMETIRENKPTKGCCDINTKDFYIYSQKKTHLLINKFINTFTFLSCSLLENNHV